VRIDGIADPAACAGGAAASKVTVTEEGGATHEITVGGKFPDKNDVAVQLGGDPHCYRMSTYAASDVAPRASGIFDVPQAFKDAPAASAVKKVAYTRDGATIHLAQPEDGKWTIESPEKGNADASRVSRLVSAVTGLHVDDLAEVARVPADLLKPAVTVALDAGGKSLTVTLLGKRLGGIGEERYVRIQGGSSVPSGFVGVVSDATAQSLLATPKELKAAS
jgi:hypothetical protein